jgi:mannose-6-phosphate isomerase-like protein (cupin superfamily)
MHLEITMNRKFRPRGYFTVPDGTEVSPFLNATDTQQSDVPWNGLAEMSIAAGRVRPRLCSSIHVHPIITQVTLLLSGNLSVRMKGKSDAEPYDLQLRAPGDAVVTRPGTLFQLRNDGDSVAEVMFIVSPPYVFEMEDGKVRYDDAVIVTQTWEELQAANYDVPALRYSDYDVSAARAEAFRRLASRKGQAPAPLAEESVYSLPAKADYLAPDGSEIRLLAPGEHGGLAHCVLPAGNTSLAVRHRTVEELWYVLDGEGEIRRQRGTEIRQDLVRQGDSIRIPVDTVFQFRAAKHSDLKLLLTTMPPWPGKAEAVRVEDAVADLWKL